MFKTQVSTALVSGERCFLAVFLHGLFLCVEKEGSHVSPSFIKIPIPLD